MNKLLIVSVLIFAAAVISLITSTTLFIIKDEIVPDSYAVVIEATSSETTLFTYKWLKDNSSQVPGHVSQVDSCSITPGIQSLKSYDYQNMESYLNYCFHRMIKNIASSTTDSTSDSQTVSVYFAATGELRLSYMFSQDFYFIINSVREYISKYRFESDKSWSASTKLASVIYGHHEALYSWISTNAIRSSVNPKKNRDTLFESSAIIHFEGASTEIAFQVDMKSRVKKTDGYDNEPYVIDTQVYGQNYSVQVQSNLCFGLNQALLRYQFLLIQETEKNTNIITDPCMPKESQTKVMREWFNFQWDYGNCLYKSRDDQWKSIPFKVYTFVGSSNQYECRNLVETLLDAERCSRKFKYCLRWDDDYRSQLFQSKNILVTFAKYSVADILGLTRDDFISQELFENQINELCKRDIKGVTDSSPNIKKDDAHEYCFQLMFAKTLLIKNYHFTKDGFMKIEFTPKTKEQTDGVALGLMINATNELPSARILITPKMSKTTFIAVTIVPVVVIILTSIVLFKFSKRQRMDNNRADTDLLFTRN